MRRTSLLARLVALMAVVAVAAVVGTAWLASTTATTFNLQKFDQNQIADSHIVDALTGYAATHASWSNVQPFIDSLARTTGRRIAIRGAFDAPVADTKEGLDIPDGQQLRIDPLAAAFDSDGLAVGDIDARAVGPYLLAPQDRVALDAIAQRVVSCYSKTGNAVVNHLPSGRPIVSTDQSSSLCDATALAQPVPSEHVALTALLNAVNDCLTVRAAPQIDAIGISPVSTDDSDAIAITFSPVSADEAALTSTVTADCLRTARVQQLQGWVAPPVDVTITDSVGDKKGVLDLTQGSVARIALISAVILALVLGVALVIGIPIVRRVRALTAAADRLAGGATGIEVPVRGGDELDQLGRAFNEMSRQRDRGEQLRSQLISDVAHELRTPLTNLLGWLEAAEDGVALHDAALNVSLLNETRQLIHIVDDLQTLTLADSDALHLRDDELDLGALLATVVESHSRRAAAAGVTVDLVVEPGLTLRGDGARLRQVVDNLLSNALNHTHERGRVTLTADDHAGQVRVRIDDTGVGISPDDLHSVFERFWRADRSRARNSGGSGLGLSIVRKIVEAHGGRVTVASELGQGTVFTVDLPRGDAGIASS